MVSRQCTAWDTDGKNRPRRGGLRAGGRGLESDPERFALRVLPVRCPLSAIRFLLMSLRLKLLFLSLLTLVLPWAGCQYARQMETALRQGQENSLVSTAQVLSRVVGSEPELLYRVPELRTNFDAAQGDFFAPLLDTEPLLDGFPDEWPAPTRDIPEVKHTTPVIHLGVHGRMMHAYVEVNAASVRYEQPSSGETQTVTPADRVVFVTRDDFGQERAWSVSAVAPGPIIVRPCQVGTPWTPSTTPLTTVTGVWRASPKGYAIELRAPLSIFGSRLAIFAVDPAGNSDAPTPSLAWLHTGSLDLKTRLEQYAPSNTRVSVVDTHGWLLARAGSIAVKLEAGQYGVVANEDGFLRSIYRPLLDRSEAPVQPYGLPYGMWGPPIDTAREGKDRALWFEAASGEPALVRAAVPIRLGDELLGALVIEQPDEHLIVLRDAALTRLLSLTLLATLIAVVGSLLFALRLSQRIRRLSRAAATALTPEGRIDTQMPETSARDEIGMLARSYGSLLGRLGEYTQYLQTLGSKLSHELRTPLTIVTSSLENINSEGTFPPGLRNYLDRARSGADRLQSILTAMSEATRVEQSIHQTERARFDLAQVVSSAGQAYQATFKRHRVQVSAPASQCWVEGSPELIVQMLDKLLDNAASFSPENGAIDVTLEEAGDVLRLSVSNDGPPLPAEIENKLFESLVSARTTTDSRPHLGLGLYIVRLIAEFHRGVARASNRADRSGVTFTIEIPRESADSGTAGHS
jgi:two-component system, OmpR family, sensor histidine kinase ChvG